MILIAASDPNLAASWHHALTPCYKVYELDAHDRRALDICLKKVPFEVLVVDLRLLGEAGVNEISDIKEIQPHLHIVVMTQAIDSREEISAIIFGAQAYCSYDLELTLLPKVIKTILSNELWVDRKFASRLLAEIEDITKSKHAEAQKLDRGIAIMTPRENEIALLVATGASNRKIAEQLNISERTVKAHLGVIFRKMEINDRLQLALYMNRHQQLSSIWHGRKLCHMRADQTDPHSEH